MKCKSHDESKAPKSLMIGSPEGGFRVVGIEEVTRGNPSKDKVVGRLEVFLANGAVIYADEIVKVLDNYDLSWSDYQCLVKAGNEGVRISPFLVRERRDFIHYGEIGLTYSKIAQHGMRKYCGGGINE